MVMTYNGHGARLTLRDRVGAFLKASTGTGQGQAPLAVTAEYNLPQARWSPRNAATHFHEGYRINSAVFACTRAVANGFAEAPLMVYADESKEEALPDHPLQKLIKRPNPYMGEDEWWKYVMTYAPIGGNAYGKIVANNGGEPSELWPYHDMVMFPVPSRTRWIEYYAYTVDNGRNVVEIPTDEIVHFKWAIDPDCPWKGMSALSPVSREVDTDNELTRYLKALLQNDAVSRGVLVIPPGVHVTPSDKETIKQDWRLKFGGMNRGDIAVLSGGMTYQRTSLDMKELALDALRGVPEARIASAYGVPAILAGLNVGLSQGSYNQIDGLMKYFALQTLVPLWRAVASEMNQSVVPLFKRPCFVDFDLSKVAALQEGQDAKAARLYTGMGAGAVKVNEYRTHGLGLPELPDGDVYQLPKGDNGYNLTPDLATFTDQSEQLQEHALAQSEAATEAAGLANETAQAALEQQQAEAAGAGGEGDTGMADDGTPDNVILLDEGQTKAAATGPGSHGGIGYIGPNGKWHYGTPPKGRKKPAPADAERAHKEAVKLAKTNAQNELSDANGDIDSLLKGGWEHDDEEGLGKSYKTAADANAWAREVGAAPDRKDRIVAVVKGSDGGYYVVSKPQSKLNMPDNGNTVTRNVAQDARQAERDKVTQERDQARADRQARQDAERTTREQARAQRQADRRARADARTAARESRQSAREARLSANEQAAGRRDAQRRTEGPKPRARRVKPSGN